MTTYAVAAHMVDFDKEPAYYKEEDIEKYKIYFCVLLWENIENTFLCEDKQGTYLNIGHDFLLILVRKKKWL